MRPFFFNRTAPTWKDKQAERFRQRQRDIAWAKGDGGAGRSARSVFRVIKTLLAGKRQLAPWEKKAILAAEEKRERRKARNLLWWANDKTWRRA